MARDATTDPRQPAIQAPAPPPLLGGRYELHDVLGRGSIGTVRAGRDVLLDRPVAVKLFPSATADPRQTDRYEQEARLLARLSHPGLVMVFDAGIDASHLEDPRPYLVMELVRGSTLADRIRRGPLPTTEVAGIASQLSTALGYIHRRGIVHRDIKPANILLADPEEPGASAAAKLTDFGIARLVDGARMTMTGFTLGTANYLSPEQLGTADVGPPSDVYSLGLVLLECLTGTVAYPGHGPEAALSRLHRAPAVPDSVPEGWRRLLTAMTAREPADRPTAADIGVAVTGLADAPPPVQTRPEPVDPAVAELATTTLPSAAAFPEERRSPVPAGAVATATQMLPVAPPLHPAGGHGARPARRRPRRSVLTTLIVAGLAAAVLAVVLAITSGSDSGGPALPTYPPVSGPLGSHLRDLQQEVTP